VQDGQSPRQDADNDDGFLYNFLIMGTYQGIGHIRWRHLLSTLALLFIVDSQPSHGSFESFFPEKLHTHKSLEPRELAKVLRVLEGKCVDNLESPDWWTYVWCFGKQIKQVHYDFKVKQLKAANLIG